MVVGFAAKFRTNFFFLPEATESADEVGWDELKMAIKSHKYFVQKKSHKY